MRPESKPNPCQGPGGDGDDNGNGDVNGDGDENVCSIGYDDNDDDKPVLHLHQP